MTGAYVLFEPGGVVALIVTIPKSAGTALMETLAGAQALPCTMHYRWPEGGPCPGYAAYRRQHSFAWELRQVDVDRLTAPGRICKTHVLPSDANLAMLEKRPKVVLLRAPEGVIGAYRRGQATGVYPQNSDAFAGCASEADWLARAEENGMLADLRRFCADWQAAPGDQLLVTYEDLMADPAHEMARIERYFGWPLSGTATLLRRKYTRLGDRSLAYHRQTADSWRTAGAE